MVKLAEEKKQVITTAAFLCFFVFCLLLLLNCECDVLRVLARIVPVMKFCEDIVLLLPTPEEMTVSLLIVFGCTIMDRNCTIYSLNDRKQLQGKKDLCC